MRRAIDVAKDLKFWAALCVGVVTVIVHVTLKVSTTASKYASAAEVAQHDKRISHVEDQVDDLKGAVNRNFVDLNARLDQWFAIGCPPVAPRPARR